MNNEITGSNVLNTVEGMVIGVIAEYTGIPASDINRETLFDHINMDSLDVIELCYNFEYHFDVDVLTRMETVGSLIDVIISAPLAQHYEGLALVPDKDRN